MKTILQCERCGKFLGQRKGKKYRAHIAQCGATEQKYGISSDSSEEENTLKEQNKKLLSKDEKLSGKIDNLFIAMKTLRKELAEEEALNHSLSKELSKYKEEIEKLKNIIEIKNNFNEFKTSTIVKLDDILKILSADDFDNPINRNGNKRKRNYLLEEKYLNLYSEVINVGSRYIDNEPIVKDILDKLSSVDSEEMFDDCVDILKLFIENNRTEDKYSDYGKISKLLDSSISNKRQKTIYPHSAKYLNL